MIFMNSHKLNFSLLKSVKNLEYNKIRELEMSNLTLNDLFTVNLREYLKNIIWT